MKTVLAAIDASAATGPVLRAAGALAELLGAEVSAVHVDGNGGGEAAAAAEHVSLQEVKGDPGQCICEAAAAADAVAVVVGARGRPFGARPTGHVAAAVLLGCDRPVLVVPPDSAVEHFHRVLLAVDTDGTHTRALKTLMPETWNPEVDVVLVHVDDENRMPAFSDQPQHETAAFAEELVARYGPAGEDTGELELRVGLPVREVLAVCDQRDADLIIGVRSAALDEEGARFVSGLLADGRVPVLLLPPAGARAHTLSS